MKIKIILLSTLFLLTACYKENEEKSVLYVYNWGDYINPDIIPLFQEETGITVKYDMYGSNEDMYTKIKNGGSSYDVVIPSDYMIEKMIREDLLEKINIDNLPNYKNIGEQFRYLEYDINNEYSVPYFWGTLGILYNIDMVEEEVNSFDILWDEKYKGKIFMYDSLRDTIGVSLKRLGYSLNTINLDELEEATEELIKQKPLVKAYLGDPIKDKMIGNEGALAIVYSGDAIYTMEESENLEYIVPKNGSNIWFDAIVIPKGSKNIKEAELFIDFLLRPDIALMNTEYVGYSTPNIAALEMLPEEIRNSNVYWPNIETFNNSEIFIDLGEYLEYYYEAWTRILLSK